MSVINLYICSQCCAALLPWNKVRERSELQHDAATWNGAAAGLKYPGEDVLTETVVFLLNYIWRSEYTSLFSILWFSVLAWMAWSRGNTLCRAACCTHNRLHWHLWTDYMTLEHLEESLYIYVTFYLWVLQILQMRDSVHWSSGNQRRETQAAAEVVSWK